MVKFLPYFHLFFMLAVFSPISGRCQSEKIEISIKSKLFQNKRNNSFVVFDDSSYYYEFKVSAAGWVKKAYTFQSDISFNNFQNQYNPIVSENGSIYFVDKGIGEVYKLVRDTLKRIDQSFHHQNQYDGCLFSYKNVLYCFGGYGLFTFKNIFTYFDENLGEWFPMELPLKSTKPDPRSHSNFQIIGDKFILIGGVQSAFEETIKFEDIWEFNFTKKEWSKLGKINRQLKPIFFQERPNNLLESLPKSNIQVYDLNVQKNEFKIYKSILFSNYQQILKDTSSNNICIVFSTREDCSHALVVSNRKALTSKISTGSVYSFNPKPKKNGPFFFILVCIGIAMIGSYLFFSKKKRTGMVSSSDIFFHRKDGLYYFQNSELEDYFEPLEILLIKKFLDEPYQILELSLTLGIFEFDEASQETAKKRRENNLKSICEKLTKKSGLSSKDIFIESRNPLDKRIKLLKLNPNLVDSTIAQN